METYATELRASRGGDGFPEDTERLARLEPMANRLSTLLAEGGPTSMRLGFYEGERLLEAAAAAARVNLVDPLMAENAKLLGMYAEGRSLPGDTAAQALRDYLLASGPKQTCADDCCEPKDEDSEGWATWQTTAQKGLLERWRVSGALSVDEILAAADAFRGWVERSWPGARWHREWPIQHRLASGTIVRGSIDVALESPAGWVIIDHKSFPGSADQAGARAAEHAGQLRAYATAIEAATGTENLETWVHMPVPGLVFRVETPKP